jgi:hypothetical protein
VEVEEPLPGGGRGPAGNGVDQPAHSGDEREDVVGGDAGMYRSGRRRAEGAHVLARATGGIDRFDQAAEAVTALVEHRYGP